MADGSLIFDTKVDTDGFQNGTNTIKKQANGLKSTFASLGKTLAVVFGITQIIRFADASIDATTELENAMMGLQSIVEGQGRSFKKAKKFIDEYISDGLVPATNAVTAYKNLASRGYSDEQIQQVMLRLKDSAAFGRQSSLTLGQAVQSATEGLKNENSILVDNAGVTKNVAKMWDDYAKSIGTSANNLTKQQKIQAEVTGIMEETKFQMGDAAKIANNYSGQVLGLGFDFNNLKIAVGNFLRPIVAVFIPVIRSAIKTLTRFANTLASISSALFGSQKQVSSYQDQSDAIGSAVDNQEALTEATKKTAKANEKTLAGFDEIQKLSEEKSSNSGKDAGVSDINIANGEKLAMELETKIDTTGADKFINEFKAKIQLLKEWFNINFGALFADMGTKIQPELTELSNTFKLTFSKLGTLAEPFKTWFKADFTTFLRTGIKTVGNIIIGLFDSFNKVFDDITNIVIVPFAESFIKTILPVITQWATQVIQTFNTLFDTTKGIFDKLWREGIVPALGSIMKIWSSTWITMKEFWDKWGVPIFDNIRTAIQKTGEVLQSVWDNFLQPVWQNFMDTVDWLWTNHIQPLLANFLDFVGELENGALEIYNKVITPIVTWLVKTLGPTFSTVFNTILNVVSSIIAGIIDVINGIITTLKGIIEFIVGVFTGDWEKAWQGVQDIFKGIWGAFVGIVKGVVNIVIDLVNGMLGLIEKGINNVIGMINNLKISNPFNGEEIWSPNVKPVSFTKIPKLATGTVVPANYGNFLAMLGDNTRETEVVSPLSTMKQALIEALREYGGQNITISFENSSIGDLVRLLKPYIDKENRRAGAKIGGAIIV